MPVAKQIAAKQWVITISKKDTNKKLPLWKIQEIPLQTQTQKVVTQEIFSFCSVILGLIVIVSTQCINTLIYGIEHREYSTAAFPDFVLFSSWEKG